MSLSPLQLFVAIKLHLFERKTFDFDFNLHYIGAENQAVQRNYYYHIEFLVCKIVVQ